MKPEDWQQTSQRYVAILDIMGFKDRVFRESHDNMLKIMLSLGEAVEVIEHFASKSQDSGTIYIRVKPLFFSDSILLVSKDDSVNSLQDIFNSCDFLVRHCISNGIPIKGAIAHGTQTADFSKSIHFGKPLVDAYLLQNELFFYGVVLHHSAQLKLEELSNPHQHFFCKLYDTPLKKAGKIKHFVIDWIESYNDPYPLENLRKLYLTVSGEPRKYVDNTIEFFNWIKLQPKLP